MVRKESVVVNKTIIKGETDDYDTFYQQLLELGFSFIVANLAAIITQKISIFYAVLDSYFLIIVILVLQILTYKIQP